MNVEVKNYTYETMPDYTEPVEGAGEIIMQGDEKGVYYIPNVVYDTPDGIPLTLQIVKPGTFSEPDRRWPCIVFVQGSAWMEQNVYRVCVRHCADTSQRPGPVPGSGGGHQKRHAVFKRPCL